MLSHVAANVEDASSVVVAGAGTGKTRTLTERVTYLLAQGVDPRSIVAITFTNKAAKEMIERVGLADRPSHERPWIGTFHSFGARFLRKHASHIGRTSSFSIYDEGDVRTLLRSIIKTLPKRMTPKQLREVFSHIKNGMTSLDELRTKGDPKSELFISAYAKYEEALKENNAFDFDDLITKTVSILTDQEALRSRMQSYIQYVLVDEYQDINEVQYQLIKLLVGTSGKLTVVGDDHQTIYSWRGSDISIFLSFQEDWPGAHVVRLEQNYRSSKNIIEASNAVIGHNKNQLEKKLTTDDVAGPEITLHEAYRDEDEALWIADTLALYKEGTAAILYRTNAQSRALEQALIRKRVPYRIYGGIQFYERREVKDVMAALRVVGNPQDELGKTRIIKTFGKRKGGMVLESLTSLPETTPGKVIGLFLERSEYLSYIEERLDNSEMRKENIIELHRFANTFKTLPEFLEQVALVQSTDMSKGKGGTSREVILMTIHMAKGLEFDRVHIAGVSEGTLPHERSLLSDADIEEERRLFYVAMTRARKELSLSFVGIPSRFILEVPEQYLVLSGGRKLALDDEERYIDVTW